MIERDFIEWLKGIGIAPARDRDIIADGVKHRYWIEGDKRGSRNGEYCLYDDESPAGWAKSYSAKHGVEYAKWSKGGRPESELSEEYFAERARRAAERSAEEERKRQNVAKNAAAILETMTAVSEDHRYVQAKGLSWPLPPGIGQMGRDLQIPLRDSDGVLWNMQSISPTGEKRFLPGRKRGCFFTIEGEGRYVFLVEGWATGVTVYEATGCTVLVCFDCGNMGVVADSVISRFAGRLVVAADNDHNTTGNPGMAAAVFKLGLEYELPIVFPRFSPATPGSDWNDYAALHGIERTSEEIFSQIEAWEADLSTRSYSVPWPDVTGKGTPLKTSGNVRALLRHLGIQVKYDLVKKRPVYEVPGVRFATDNEDNAYFSFLVSECARSGFNLGKAMLELFLFEIQDEGRFNPVREWIVARGWDGVDRFGALCASVTLSSSYPEDFFRVLLRRWLISCAAAVFAAPEEELQFRGVLTLAGPQASGKTMWLRSLVPAGSGWFLDGLTLDVRDKDSVTKAISHWIVELGELDSTFKAQDVARLKGFVTQASDNVRLPYAPKPSVYPRRTVFCASVNPSQFLPDMTGNTRWWTISVRKCDFKHGLDLQQLWAQVRTWFDEGERYWLDEGEQARLADVNEGAESPDSVRELIARHWDWDGIDEAIEEGRTELLTTTEVLAKCGIDKGRATRQQTAAGAAVLRELTGRESVRVGKGRSRVFHVPLTELASDQGDLYRQIYGR